MRPEHFLDIVSGDQKQPSTYRLGKIPASYTSGRPTVLFDGESTDSARSYPYLSSYTPAANDRVLVAVVGHGGVVIGKIV